MIDIQRVLDVLNARRVRDYWVARCPSHDDRMPSLTIRLLPSGRLYLRCFAGCPIQSITRAIGLPLETYGVEPRRSLARMENRTIECTYDYADESGVVRYQKVRFIPKSFSFRRPDGKGNWLWSMQDYDGVRLLYNLPEILAKPQQPVLVCEGEKDVETLRRFGLVGTSNDGGANNWQPHLGRWLRGRRVAILPDRDEAGHRHALHVAAHLLEFAASIRIVHLPGGDGEDVTDFLSNRLPGTTDAQAKAALLDFVRRAPEWRLVEKEVSA